MRRVTKFLFLIAVIAITSCAESDRVHRIMSYNVKTCRGMDDVLDYDRVANVIRDTKSEIIALQELDSATKRSNNMITGLELAKRLDMHFTFAPAIDYGGGKYGVGILSKERPVSYRYFPLPGASEARVFLLAEFNDYYFASTHLSLTDQEREESVRIIIDSLKNIKNKPVFVCGDFNTTPETAPIKLMESKFTMLNAEDDHTFPVDVPRITIDYIFGSNNGYGYTIKEQVVIQERMASDHLPLYVDVIID